MSVAKTAFGVWEYLDDLLTIASEVAGVDMQYMHEIGRTVIAKVAQPGEPPGGPSGLNHDGSPLELCFSARKDTLRCRLIGDPATGFTDSIQRYQAAYNSMLTALALTRATDLRQLFERTLALVLPDDPRQSYNEAYTHGVMWLGAGVDTPGAALYVVPTASFSNLRTWLQAILPDMSAADSVLRNLQGKTRRIWASVEGRTLQDTRVKLYWRLSAPLSLADLGIERFTDPAFPQFLAIALGTHQMYLSGVVFNVAFRVATGEISDVKLDLCTCKRCLARTASEWSETMDQLAETFGVVRMPIERCMAHGEVVFLGFGLGQHTEPRINVYFMGKDPAQKMA